MRNAYTSNKHKNPTMRDVARRVGVSVQTVSAVINEKPGITIETRDRVLLAIQELGYRPFSVARSLRTRQTNTVALIVPDIANPSFSTIASAAEDLAHACGYSLIHYNTHESIEREASYIRTAAMRWVDGVLFVSARDHMSALETLQAAGIPCVAIDRIPQSYAGPSVTLDNTRAGEMAAGHLISLGHRRIAHISGPLRLRVARERLEGFQAASALQGLPDPFVVNSTGWNCEEGYAAMQELLKREQPIPTGLFAASDRLAIGAIKAAHEAGLRIPQDLSVIGLDDIEVAAFQIPPLTTLRQSFANLATLAMQILLAILNDETPEETQVILEPELVVRESTGRPGLTLTPGPSPW
jgi:LacI family transcriptional regulator